ncbi:MAG: lysophospholipase [Firmicutes bacterium]|nr:lysophospholipase [Bacillota bacterium]MCL2256062.1 lysophospholipase [Bacillota bacterium]
MTNFLFSTLSQNAWIIIGSVLGFILLVGIVLIFLTAFIIFRKTLYRSPKTKRVREYSVITNMYDPDGTIQNDKIQMFEEGIEWSKQFKDKIEDVHIVNDGLNLYGQYMNLGFDKCAIVIQGRTESLLYSYYFASAYAKSGYNILVIDTRAHGLSDGKYVTAGILEYRDLIKWIKFVEEKYSIKSFVVHGICIGAANAIYAYEELKKKGGEDANLIKKIVLDGTFISYFEIFRQHHIERKKPVFPFVQLISFFLFLATGARVFKKTPLKAMPNIDIPVLFIYSKQDVYCTPEKTQQLYDACASENKELRLFPKGRHSHVRIRQPEDYDQAILDFLEKHKN